MPFFTWQTSIHGSEKNAPIKALDVWYLHLGRFGPEKLLFSHISFSSSSIWPCKYAEASYQQPASIL